MKYEVTSTLEEDFAKLGLKVPERVEESEENVEEGMKKMKKASSAERRARKAYAKLSKVKKAKERYAKSSKGKRQAAKHAKMVAKKGGAKKGYFFRTENVDTFDAFLDDLHQVATALSEDSGISAEEALVTFDGIFEASIALRNFFASLLEADWADNESDNNIVEEIACTAEAFGELADIAEEVADKIEDESLEEEEEAEVGDILSDCIYEIVDGIDLYKGCMPGEE